MSQTKHEKTPSPPIKPSKIMNRTRSLLTTCARHQFRSVAGPAGSHLVTNEQRKQHIPTTQRNSNVVVVRVVESSMARKPGVVQRRQQTFYAPTWPHHVVQNAPITTTTPPTLCCCCFMVVYNMARQQLRASSEKTTSKSCVCKLTCSMRCCWYFARRYWLFRRWSSARRQHKWT